MNRTLRVLAAVALVVCTVPAAAQGVTSVGFVVVEQFLAAVSDADVERALGYLDADAVGLEVAAGHRVMRGNFQFRRWIDELIADGIRMDTALLEVHGDGSVFVTLDRTWGDAIPPDLTPLHGTGTYLVQDGRLIALTRLTVPGQRDAWMAGLIAGRWSCGGYAWDVSSDGRYALTSVRDALRVDSGRLDVVEGALHLVSDEASTICGTGETGVYTLSFSGRDRFHVWKLEDACAPRAPDEGSVYRVLDD